MTDADDRGMTARMEELEKKHPKMEQRFAKLENQMEDKLLEMKQQYEHRFAQLENQVEVLTKARDDALHWVQHIMNDLTEVQDVLGEILVVLHNLVIHLVDDVHRSGPSF